MAVAWYMARRRDYPTEEFPGFAMMRRLLVDAAPGLILVVIIFGGGRSGIFTVSESSGIAVVYALLITVFAYRALNWEAFVGATLGAGRTTAVVLLVIGRAAGFGWLLAYLRIPADLVGFMQGLSDNSIVILLMINITPIFLPVAMAFGVNPVHFGIILILNLGIG